MASELEWADAYLTQAREDFRAADAVQGVAPSVLAMLLQMVLEKLGKAALLRSGVMTVERARGTHQVAARMMHVIGQSRRKCQRLGLNREHVRRRITPVVDQLEALNPSVVARRGGDGPWLEYPWEEPGGAIQWPARHLPGLEAFRPRGVQGILLFNLTSRLCRQFDEVFA